MLLALNVTVVPLLPQDLVTSADALTAGPDGNFWFIDGGAIGRTTPSGVATEFSVANADDSRLNGLATGPDGNLWFTENDQDPFQANQIGRITPAGVVTKFPLVLGSVPGGIVTGPDGNLWFTETGYDQQGDQIGGIGRITPAGNITERPTGDSVFEPGQIAAGRDGNLYFTETIDQTEGQTNTERGVIVQLPTKGTSFTRIDLGQGEPVPSAENPQKLVPTSYLPDAITTGPDGNIWFADHLSAIEATLPSPRIEIGRITRSGGFVADSLPDFAMVNVLAPGPDGNLWFSQTDTNGDVGAGILSQIGRMTTAGTVTIFPLPSTIQGVDSIVTGPDHNLWLSDFGESQIVRLVPPADVTGALVRTNTPRALATENATNNPRPAFNGVAHPGATVRLFAQPTGGGRIVPLGRARADSHGNWRLAAARRLRDGSYSVTATETSGQVHSTAPQSLFPFDFSGPLVIDTVAPRVTNLTFDPATKQFSITYVDQGAGMGRDVVTQSYSSLGSLDYLGDPTNYRVTKAGSRTPLSINFDYNFSTEPSGTVTVTGSITDPRPEQPGSYTLTIFSQNVTDLAGSALDGEFRGRFPSGNGRAGGNFLITLGAGGPRAAVSGSARLS